MANLMSVRLSKGDASSWGFRLQGGKDFGTPLIIQKINGGSPAEKAGLISGDAVIRINNVDVFNLKHKDAQDVILRAGPSFEVTVQRGGLTWKPAVSPVGSVTSPRPAQPANNISPVTATSLAAGRQENIGAIGTTHNNSAKPFNAVNGGPALVNKQYNSPLGLYSEQSIAETLSAQSEVLSNGVVGVNFKKNEKSYDSANSAVFRMVQEADKEPRDYYEPEVDTTNSGVITAPLGVAGLRHVQAPEYKPAPPPQQLPPGQNICADCERLIVGVFVRIKDKNLHVECFKCSTCGSSLKNVGYYNLNNKLYCDVHAKLAVKNNPPAPNLVPVAVQPGGHIPSGTISAALASHPLPSAGPVSPNSHYTPTYQPIGHPYTGSVGQPVKPTVCFPTYSPVPAAPQPEIRCVQNTVWPPPPKELELPTASPLYFPPPSQVHIPQKSLKIEDQEPSEPDYTNYKTPLGSMEILNITGSRVMIESSETISGSIETQMLVDSVLKSNLKTEGFCTKPGDVAVSFTISEADLKRGYCSDACKNKECRNISYTEKDIESTPSCTSLYDSVKCSQRKSSISENRNKICSKQETHSKEKEVYEAKACLKQEQNHCLSSIYEKAIKVENTVPHKWESPMVVALTVAPDHPYSPIPSEPDSFLPIAPKRSTTALGAALAVAPSEPFTPAPHSSLEPVPLPELTVPYFPPEHPIVIEPKEPKIEEADCQPTKVSKTNEKSPAKKNKKQIKSDTDEFLKDLPKPTGKVSMLAALTTAPDRPYSPFSQHETESVRSESCEPEVEVIQEEPPPKPEPKPKVFPKPEPCAAVFTAPERLYSPFTANKSSYEAEVLETEKSLKSSISEQHSVEKHETKNIQTTENVTNISTGCPPLIHCIKSTFETKTDKVHMEMSCALPCEPVTTKRFIEKKTDIIEEKSVCDKQSSRKQILEEETRLQKEVKMIKNSETSLSQNEASIQNVKLLKDKTIEKVHVNKQQINQVATNPDMRKEVTESTLIQEACSRIQNNAHVEQNNDTALRERVTIIQPGQVNLNVPQIAFQPVSDESARDTEFSPRPRSLTPSMINKPASTLPYYQANLVATQQPRAESSIFDPKSPALSRSPSPYPGLSSSPFASSTARAVSPAPGPPPNPLKSNTPVTTIIRDAKLDQARNYVQSYIPQHKSANTCGSVSGQASSFQQSSSMSGCKGAQSKSSCNKSDYCERATCSQISDTQQCSSAGFCGEKVQCKSMCNQEQTFERSNLSKADVQVAGDNNIQVQRRKVVKEEYARSLNSVQLDKHTNNSKVCVTEKNDNCAVGGMHLTNPQPLKSPFIKGQKQEQIDSQQIPALSTAIPKLIKALPKPNISSNVNVKPNISQPNSGTGGGRQSGAVGVAPKRGRGVLNLAATPGSRVPLCGHCHGNISETKFEDVNPAKEYANVDELTSTFNQISINIPSEKTQFLKPKVSKLSNGSPKVPIRNVSPNPFPGIQNSYDTLLVPPADYIPAHEENGVSKHPLLQTSLVQNSFYKTAPINGAIFKQNTATPNEEITKNSSLLNNSNLQVCNICDISITRGPFITALGKIWCPEHFTCATPSCRRPLQDLGFVEEQGQLYCEYCFEKYLAPPCSKCNIKVKGDCLKAIGKMFHPECFNCAYCGKLFGNSPFFLEDAQPYCENDWNELFTTKCFACGFPVEAGDRWVEALNNNYHSQCFNCTMCKKNLEGQSFFAKGGRPFCKNHAR